MHALTMSPLQCRILSLLAGSGGRDGLSYAALSQIAKVDRPTLYVLMRRMAAAKWVKRSTIILRGPGRRDVPETHALYAVTAAGIKARRRFSQELGFTLHAIDDAGEGWR
jgi:DNA-binding PadR family transcriptional regulator